jgi:hypothetical protein
LVAVVFERLQFGLEVLDVGWGAASIEERPGAGAGLSVAAMSEDVNDVVAVRVDERVDVVVVLVNHSWGSLVLVVARTASSAAVPSGHRVWLVGGSQGQVRLNQYSPCLSVEGGLAVRRQLELRIGERVSRNV